MHEMAKGMDTATRYQTSSTKARFCRFGSVNVGSQKFSLQKNIETVHKIEFGTGMRKVPPPKVSNWPSETH
jgi:hypothetical protein